MAEDDSLAALQGLHRDLCAHIDLQLPVLERLVLNLEAHLEELKTLLASKLGGGDHAPVPEVTSAYGAAPHD